MAIFYVEGNDAQTIAAAAAASIENAAEQRARAEADKTGGKPTMTFFASAQEAAVVIAANDLRAQYKEEFGLAKRPILLPYGSPLMPYQGQHNQGSRDGTFHRYERRFAGGGVSHVELAKILLSRVWLKRCGEALYMRKHPCFRRLTDNQLSSLIHLQCYGLVAMAERFGYVGHIRAVGNRNACKGVTQLVRAKIRQPAMVGQFFEIARGALRVHWLRTTLLCKSIGTTITVERERELFGKELNTECK